MAEALQPARDISRQRKIPNPDVASLGGADLPTFSLLWLLQQNLESVRAQARVLAHGSSLCTDTGTG